jgi:uncharacterized protein YpmB
MKTWKVWLTVAVLIIGMAAMAVAASLWNNLSTEWNMEAEAAQFALDHSPLQRITDHGVFTASGVQEVFGGTDAFGRHWIVCVSGPPWKAWFTRADGLTSVDAVATTVRRMGVVPVSIQAGHLEPAAQSAFHTNAQVVYEVYGRNASGQSLYLYFDAKSGQLVWKYLL